MSKTNPKPTAEKTWEDLQPKQKRVIELLVSEPELSNSEIADRVDCHPTYPTKIRNKFPHIIEQLKSERFEDRSRGHASMTSQIELMDGRELGVEDEVAEQWNGLKEDAEKRAKVITALLKEDDPLNPERTYTSIAEEAGTSGSYVSTVLEENEALIKTLASASEVTKETEEETETTTTEVSSISGQVSLTRIQKLRKKLSNIRSLAEKELNAANLRAESAQARKGLSEEIIEDLDEIVEEAESEKVKAEA